MRRFPTVSDDGSGSVLVLALVAVLCTGIVLLALLGGAAAARHRAQTAADLAALAAADVLLGRRPGSPCATAGQVATANGARVRVCSEQADGTVVVAVEVATDGVLAGLGPAGATARAGAQPAAAAP